ncbi:protein of unknown function [Rhodovastum atsumiense]|nr:protein of unknown function [Rhodovastum atsumiense]
MSRGVGEKPRHGNPYRLPTGRLSIPNE